MRIRAMMQRILKQFKGDKRTVGLMIMAPIVILTLLYFVFDAEDPIIRYGWVSGPIEVRNELINERVKILDGTEADLKALLATYDLDAVIMINWPDVQIEVEGSDPAIAKRAQALLIKSITSDAMQEKLKSDAVDSFKTKLNDKLSKLPQGQMIVKQITSSSEGTDEIISIKKPIITDTYLYGSDDMSSFDNFGSVLLGFFVFFFTFLVSGISFLRERTTGTLERLLVSPIRRHEVVLGYVAGFGVFTLLQSTIIGLYTVYVLKMQMIGSFALVLLTILLLAMVALTLGILLSSFAKNEFQMVQFIPLVIVPQVFFSGLFRMNDWPQWLQTIEYLTPLHYAAAALRDVMIRGAGFSEIWQECSVLFGLSVAFIIMNILALKRLRKL